MQAALHEARIAYTEGEVPVGAVIVVDERILSSNHNRIEQRHDPLAHAETLVIRDACREMHYERLADATMYVTVEPCSMCAGAMLLARIRRVVYGVDNPKAGAVRSLYSLVEDSRLNHHIEVVSGVLSAECRHIMQSFFRQLRTGEVPKWS
ncbi:tRNA-specific adenosine deaminase [candidate division KSB3 bacterium]|uniref:tRNA-specific adenosine deaminase n=1 Tax=candidate division KSB3 bacterium TaxID=2044937 RepID=A0A2G6E3P5_9BACT|nr:MAG: tRNA-specific adenosine deaminase [candidate division KSB3 bacterium]PIE29131.1 MAG: tRNA-specific adenosine deaminase [candidate division KSB3 bacterium]